MSDEFADVTTSALIDMVRADCSATPREIELLDRLCSAMDEIDDLVNELTRTNAEVYCGDDA